MENTVTHLIPDPEAKPLLRPSEVAPMLKWSKNTVYALIKSGELEAITVRGRFWIPTSSLRRYLRLDAA
jgi:excisionase family DNA binding protein